VRIFAHPRHRRLARQRVSRPRLSVALRADRGGRAGDQRVASKLPRAGRGRGTGLCRCRHQGRGAGISRYARCLRQRQFRHLRRGRRNACRDRDAWTSRLVVPIENVADGHQAANAAAFSARSSLPALRESQWDEGRAAALVNELLAKPPHRNETAPHSHAKAALHVVGICEELLAAKQRRAGSAAPIARSVRPAKS